MTRITRNEAAGYVAETLLEARRLIDNTDFDAVADKLSAVFKEGPIGKIQLLLMTVDQWRQLAEHLAKGGIWAELPVDQVDESEQPLLVEAGWTKPVDDDAATHADKVAP